MIQHDLRAKNLSLLAKTGPFQVKERKREGRGGMPRTLDDIEATRPAPISRRASTKVSALATGTAVHGYSDEGGYSGTWALIKETERGPRPTVS